MTRAKSVTLVLSLMIVLCVCQFAQAAFLPAFTGNTQFIDPDASSDGVVNFAVYQNPGGDWTDDFPEVPVSAFKELFEVTPGPNGIGNGIDITAAFVYMYQVVNTDPDTDDESVLKQLELFFPVVGATAVSSAGYIAGFVFDDPTDADLDTVADGATGPASGAAKNTRLGIEPNVTGGTDDEGGDHLPSESGVALTGFAAIGGTIAPNNAEQSGLFRVQFLWDTPGTVIPTGAFSPVVFITSNLPPMYWIEQLEDGDDTVADIPIPNPEPRTIVMSLGVLVCGLVALARAKAKIS
jgi:hypothetical protein